MKNDNIINMNDEIYVKCEQNLKSCFAYREDGTCDCLINTCFDKPCPFYQSKKQFELKKAKEIEKLKNKPSKPF